MYPDDMVSFVLCFVYKVISLLSNGILPVFIFDGKPPLEKNRVIKKRFINRKQIKERLQRLQGIPFKDKKTREQINRLQKQNFVVTRKHRESVQEILTVIGIPWFKAPGEAEEFCASLQKRKLIDYTVSDDTDTFVFGCNKVIRLIKNSNTFVNEIDLNVILRKFGLTHQQFVDFCILSGCDYSESSNGINIKMCYNLMKKYGNIEDCIDELKKKYSFPENFNYVRIREIYNNETEYDFEEIKSKIMLNEFNERHFIDILYNTYNLPMIEIKKFILKTKCANRDFFIYTK
ncbi:hypothetical protein [Heterosigma akashiwo virus 01]|uniref:XPG-I domain-containing protein n=1 Tax=Heterosigma akashiwo virus 01 TaxID=97195 RepID=A0A1C9C590_HAV01|nr:hypothetical protein D1R72_gp123 [Heterosigma akashiwo virus 01]AOM63454.1 hypothetical protein [Heterosigma akashiwo virus 01]